MYVYEEGRWEDVIKKAARRCSVFRYGKRARRLRKVRKGPYGESPPRITAKSPDSRAWTIRQLFSCKAQSFEHFY